MIRPVEDKKRTIEIDLTGPDGNVFVLMRYAKHLSQLLNLNYEKIRDDMKSDDYEHTIEVFEKHFGDHVILYR